MVECPVTSKNNTGLRSEMILKAVNEACQGKCSYPYSIWRWYFLLLVYIKLRSQKLIELDHSSTEPSPCIQENSWKRLRYLSWQTASWVVDDLKRSWWSSLGKSIQPIIWREISFLLLDFTKPFVLRDYWSWTSFTEPSPPQVRKPWEKTSMSVTAACIMSVSWIR